MAKKRKQFTSEFKTKVVLELLEGNATINELASKYGILPRSIHSWKKQFLENASLAFESAIPAKKYKEEIREKDRKIEELYKALGKTQIERDWVLKKLRSLGLKIRKSLVESKLKKLPITRQCELLNMGRSYIYYKPKPKISDYDIHIMNRIDEIYTIHPYYGYRRMFHSLKQEGFLLSMKKTAKLMKIMNLKALYPKVRKINTSIPENNSKKYPYLLKGIKIERPNQVWASDITYIRLAKGFAYLCAVIDLYSRAILSYKLSPVMDDELVAKTIENAIDKHKTTPEIFNSDQGSQYTSKKTIDILKKHNISISMDAKGRCYDNIIMERFWRSLKQENIYPSRYKTITEARVGIDEYINTYNTKRLHSSIGYMPPLKFYNQEIKEEVA